MCAFRTIWNLAHFLSLHLCMIILRVGLRQTYDRARGEDNISLPWPAQTVLEVGVPFYLLLASYDIQLLESSSVGGIDATMR